MGPLFALFMQQMEMKKGVTQNHSLAPTAQQTSPPWTVCSLGAKDKKGETFKHLPHPTPTKYTDIRLPSNGPRLTPILLGCTQEFRPILGNGAFQPKCPGESVNVNLDFPTEVSRKNHFPPVLDEKHYWGL